MEFRIKLYTENIKKWLILLDFPLLIRKWENTEKENSFVSHVRFHENVA